MCGGYSVKFVCSTVRISESMSAMGLGRAPGVGSWAGADGAGAGAGAGAASFSLLVSCEDGVLGAGSDDGRGGLGGGMFILGMENSVCAIFSICAMTWGKRAGQRELGRCDGLSAIHL